jgi:LytS/YehU family sensor histidine kinase
MTLSQNHIQALNNHLSKHFIFNTLNSINSFIVENNAAVATNYLSKFGKLLRMVIEHSNQVFISLQKEIETLELYVFMEKMRFQNGIAVDIKVASNIDAAGILVPPFVLQPYIESAIWHSLASETVNQILIEIILVGENKIAYHITSAKTKGKPKLRQLLLPDEIAKQIQQTDTWLDKNSSLFEIENIDLYNHEHTIVANKTIITLSINH